MCLLMTAIVPLLFALPAQAQQWHLVGGNGQIRTYMDADSIQRKGDTATATVLSAFAKPVGKVYAFRLDIVYDCTKMRFRELDGVNYSATGSVISNDPAREPDRFYDTHPNGVDEAGRNYACFGGDARLIEDPFADSAKRFGWTP